MGPLKTYICQALRVSSIKKASILWERDFAAPVSRLLIDHSEEMKQDAIRQDILFKAIDDYMAQLEKDQKEFVDKACKHDWEV